MHVSVHGFTLSLVLSAVCAESSLSITNDFISHLMSHVSVVTVCSLTVSLSFSLLSNYKPMMFLSELPLITVAERMWLAMKSLVLWLAWAGERRWLEARCVSSDLSAVAAWQLDVRLAVTTSRVKILKTTTPRGRRAQRLMPHVSNACCIMHVDIHMHEYTIYI